LLDARLKPQAIDVDFIRWMGEHHLPLVILLTKSDKLKQQELAKSRKTIEAKLLEQWEDLPTLFVTSAEKKSGRDKILDFISEAMQGDD
jgi:GTP-binding protein